MLISIVRTLATALPILLILASESRGQYYDESPADWRVIYSEGEADTLVKPDEIVFFLRIEASHLNIDSARIEYEKKMEKLTELTRKMKIREEDIRMNLLDMEPDDLIRGMEGTDFNPRAFSSSSDESDLREYYVMRSITLTLRDHSKYTEFLAELLKGGIELERSPLSRVSNPAEIRNQLTLRAIRNARRHAETLAGEVGMRIADPIRVGQPEWYGGSDYSYGSYGNPYGGDYGVSEGRRSPLTPDMISFTVSVSVTFQMVSQSETK